MLTVLGQNEKEKRQFDSLYAASHGVLNKNFGTAMSDTSRILVIGLGGRGVSTVAALKQKIIDRVGGIDPHVIQFLAIDTDSDDKNKFRDMGIFTNAETPLISNSNIQLMLRLPPDQIPSQIRSVIPDNFSIKASTDKGAAQTRLLGRLTVMDANIFNNAIVDPIKDAIQTLRDFTTKELHVYVVAGIGGGTGSGLVIDIPYIVRHIATKVLSVNSTSVHISGYVYLPNTYDKVPNVNHEATYENGYAALKEIDYYMNLSAKNPNTGTLKDCFDAQYPGLYVSSRENIFDTCTLVGGEQPNTDLADPAAASMDVCVSDLLTQVTKVVGDATAGNERIQNTSLASFFTSASFLSNASRALGTVLTNSNYNGFSHVGSYNYQYIGSSSVVFPTEAIVNAFLAKVFAASGKKLQENAGLIKQADVDAFERGLISPIELINRGIEDIEQKAADLINNPKLKWDKATILSNSHDSVIETQLNEMAGKVAFSFDAAMASANSKASKIYQDMQKGPFFLRSLLYSDPNKGGTVVGYFTKIANYDTTLNEFLKRLRLQLRETKENREKSAAALQSAGKLFGKFDKELTNYKALTVEYFKLKYQIVLAEKFAAEINPVSPKVGIVTRMQENLCDSYVAKIDAYEILDGIISSNYEATRGALNTQHPKANSVFALEGQVFDQLKETLRTFADREFTALGDAGSYQFTATLLSAIAANENDKWKIQRGDISTVMEGEFTKSFRSLLANYDNQNFRRVIDSGLLGFLDEAYHNEASAVKQQVVNALVSFIQQSARPMCCPWQLFSWNTVSELNYNSLVLPAELFPATAANDPNSWGSLFSAAFGGGSNNRNVFKSPDKSSISQHSLYVKMPIWVCKDLVKYEKAYFHFTYPDSFPGVGVHINENPALDFPLRDFPPLFLQDQWTRANEGSDEYSIPVELDFVSKLTEDFNWALTQKIAEFRGGTCFLDLVEEKPDDKLGDKFVKKYLDSEDNKDSNGAVLLEGNAYPQYRDFCRANRVTVNTFEILGINDVKADTPENAVKLLRQQTVLIAKLRAAIALFKESAYNKLMTEQTNGLETRKRRDFAKYMVYGLVTDNGDGKIWNYDLAGTKYRIITAADVSNGPKSWMRPYIEYAACKAFYTLDDWVAHKKLLEKRVKSISDKVYDDPALKETLQANYDNFAAKTARIIDAFMDKEDSGAVLNEREQDVLKFYKTLKSALDDVISAF